MKLWTESSYEFYAEGFNIIAANMKSSTDKNIKQQRVPMLVALNADVVSYSRLFADDNAATVEAMTRAQKVVEKGVASTGGTLVNFVGDNFMAVFDTAENALKSAITITTNIANDSFFILDHGRFMFRMGMDMGEVVITEDGQYLGDALNIAARIQAIARAGGISVSGSVFVALDEPALRFQSVGARSLKNIPEQVMVYEFSDLPANYDTSTASPRKLALDNPKVAVLPMHAEGVDQSILASCELLTSNTVVALVQEPHLDVVDASQMAPDKIEQMPLQSRVRYMLSMGAIPISTGLHIYAKIMEVATVNVVWAGKWNIDTDDLPVKIDDITNEIVRTFEVELIAGVPAELNYSLEDPLAIRKITQGWYLLTSDTQNGWYSAINLFEELCQSHPAESVAPALAAFAHWMVASQNLAPQPKCDYQKAREYAIRGIDLNDETGLCKMVLAAISIDENKPDEALALIESASITRPTCDVTFALHGSIRRYLGQWQQAIPLIDRAMNLTVVDTPWYPTVLASSYYIGKKYEEAVGTAEEILAYQPANLEALSVLAASQVELGLDRRAHATAQQITEYFPDVNIDDWLRTQPYQNKDFITQWGRDLEAAGVENTTQH